MGWFILNLHNCSSKKVFDYRQRNSRICREQNFSCWRDAENLKKPQRAEFELLRGHGEPQEDSESRISASEGTQRTSEYAESRNWHAELTQWTSRIGREQKLACWTNTENLKNTQRAKSGLLYLHREPQEDAESRIWAAAWNLCGFVRLDFDRWTSTPLKPIIK